MLQHLIVLYRPQDAGRFSTPLGFACQADHSLHAEEQCLDAYPGAEVLWVSTSPTLDAALKDYYTANEPL